MIRKYIMVRKFPNLNNYHKFMFQLFSIKNSQLSKVSFLFLKFFLKHDVNRFN